MDTRTRIVLLLLTIQPPYGEKNNSVWTNRMQTTFGV